MRPSARKRKKLEYPGETNGSRWAAEARRLASKLTPEQEAEHFRRAMVKIYGSQPKAGVLDLLIFLPGLVGSDYLSQFR